MNENNKWEEIAQQSSAEEEPEATQESIEEKPEEESIDLSALSPAADFEKEKAYLLAEVQNVRMRAEKEVRQARQFGIEKLLEALLPVMDSLDRALIAAKESGEGEQMHEGLNLTLKLFQETLARFGAEPVSPEVGAAFDPNLHEAMITQPKAEDGAANVVVQVFEKGYVLHGRLIRPARVMVTV